MDGDVVRQDFRRKTLRDVVRRRLEERRREVVARVVPTLHFRFRVLLCRLQCLIIHTGSAVELDLVQPLKLRAIYGCTEETRCVRCKDWSLNLTVNVINQDTGVGHY